MPSAWQKRQFVESLYAGGVVAYPTEAVYGLGCHPLSETGVASLLRIKNRPWQKGLILIAANFLQLKPYLKPISEDLYKAMHRPQERPTTWVLPARKDCPAWLTGTHQTIAVRLVEHALAKEICALSNTALVSTSANITGQPAIRTGWQTRLRFAALGVTVLNGATGGSSAPSRIIDPIKGLNLR